MRTQKGLCNKISFTEGVRCIRRLIKLITILDRSGHSGITMVDVEFQALMTGTMQSEQATMEYANCIAGEVSWATLTELGDFPREMH